jgi:hypothetical protein
MSSANPPLQNFSFDPLAVIAVNEAYDLACKTLQNIGQLEVDREIIARGILRAARLASGTQQTVRACYPWIDRVRLSAGWRLRPD